MGKKRERMIESQGMDVAKRPVDCRWEGGGERDDLPRKIRVDEFHNELTGYSNPVQPLLL